MTQKLINPTPRQYWEVYALEHENQKFRRPSFTELDQQAKIKHLIGNVDGLTILKTDLWNEAIRRGCFMVEEYSNAKQFYGVDISQRICDIASKKHSWLTIKRGEIPYVLKEFDTKQFDLILDISTLDHVDFYQKAISEYARIIKDKGRLLIIWNKYNQIANFYVYIRKLTKNKVPVKHPYHYQYSISNIFNHLENNDFKIIKDGPWNVPFSCLLNGLNNWNYLNHWVLVQKMNEKYEFCGYSNCFRPFYKMRGFMPCCEFHYKNPKKWGKDGMTYTGSVFKKIQVSNKSAESLTKVDNE